MAQELSSADNISTDIIPTDILRCDPHSISFSNDEWAIPESSCSKTTSALQLASHLIRSDSLVAFPTETVYGLGANATSSRAVSKIYQTKGRPSDNPLIVHVSSLGLLSTFLPPDWHLNETYQILVQRFWPGPLTILVPTTSAEQPISKIPDVVTCGLRTVAVRIPSHPVARALIAQSGSPIAAPSANLSGRPSPTQAIHVKRDLETRIELILDGGPCEVGVESTVVDGLNPDGRLRVLRLGGLSVEDITQCLRDAAAAGVIGEVPTVEVYNGHGKDLLSTELKPTTPGMKYKHYSPKAKVILINLLETEDTSDLKDILTPLELISNYVTNSKSHTSGTSVSIGLMMTENSQLLDQFHLCEKDLNPDQVNFHYSNLGTITQPDVSAQRLFSSMRYLDEEVLVDVIFVEQLPSSGLGSTVMERLYKASNTHIVTCVRVSA